MGIYRTQQRLGVETSKKSTNTDTFLKVNLDNKQRLLPPDEINNIVDVGQRFNLERQSCNYYRILGTINPIVTNALFNLDNQINNHVQTWKGFNNLSFLDTSFPKDGDVTDLTDSNYSDSIKNNLKEVDGWFGYIDPDKTKSGLCNYFDMEPIRSRFSFIQDINPFNGKIGNSPIKNWEATITYPYEIDSSHNMVNGGLLIIDIKPVIVSTKSMTAFAVGCLHNLSDGDTVNISGTSGYDGTYTVSRLGLDNGDLKEYYFVIDLPTNGSIGPNSRMTRVVNGNNSTYYFRKFKKIKTRNKPMIEANDFETYKLSFSNNIYTDSLTHYIFNEDIDITDLVDNLGRPLSQLYLSRIKTDSNGLFTNVSSGIETPYITSLINSNINTYLQSIPAINMIHNGGQLPFPSHTPLETNISINSDIFYGDLVEYNTLELQEVILADVSHRFNTNNRETQANFDYYDIIGPNPITKNIDLGPRQEGYFYKAHNLITIREFSAYIEQGDSSTVGIPNYAEETADGSYTWRDMLDIGFNESNDKPLNYPFLNGCHYIYVNECFNVRRQDPFDNWGLYYSKFPADPIGQIMTDNYTINSEDDVC